MSVRLRALDPGDRERLRDWRNRPEVSTYMYTDRQITPDEHARWFDAAMAAADRRYWIIELDGEPVGLTNLTRIDPVSRRCNLGYYLAEPGVRGRGVGAAAEFTVIEHAFNDLALNKLCSEVLVENEPSWKMLESFGFRREAHWRDHVWKSGRFHDAFGLGLLARDWETARAVSAARLAERGYGARDMMLEAAG